MRGVKKGGAATEAAVRVVRSKDWGAAGSAASRPGRVRYEKWPSRVRRSGRAGGEGIAAESTQNSWVHQQSGAGQSAAMNEPPNKCQHRPSGRVSHFTVTSQWLEHAAHGCISRCWRPTPSFIPRRVDIVAAVELGRRAQLSSSAVELWTSPAAAHSRQIL